MSSINRAILIGNLGKDPELRYTSSGDAVANFSIATSDRWKDKATGEQMEQTEWHRIVLFKRLAEIAGEYLQKGAKVYIEGKITTRSYDKDGETRYITEIRGERLVMLGAREEGAAPAHESQHRTPPAKSARAKAPAKTGAFDDLDDDIPF